MSSCRFPDVEKTMLNTLLAKKVVAFAYGRWSFTRGFGIRLCLRTFDVLEGGLLWEMVAYERWSHAEVRLY